jgi:hypothetical protein
MYIQHPSQLQPEKKSEGRNQCSQMKISLASLARQVGEKGKKSEEPSIKPLMVSNTNRKSSEKSSANTAAAESPSHKNTALRFVHDPSF